MLKPISIPGLLIVGTDTGVGKTVIAGAIAQWFLRRGISVGVCKPAATGCVHQREGWVSPDAEFLASCADSPEPLDVICPQRFAEPLAPAVAAERAKRPLDWEAIQRSLSEISAKHQAIIIEGIGGVMVPMDASYTFLHVAHWLNVPAVVVARPGLGTINHTLLTLGALHSAGVPIAGVIINRYPAENATVAEETNPQAIERWSGASVLCVVPDQPVRGMMVPPEIAQPIDAVDWARLSTLAVSRRK